MDGPARCLTVDSPDASHLLADHIVSHNTQAGLWLLEQYSRLTNSRGANPDHFPGLEGEVRFLRGSRRTTRTTGSLDRLPTAGGVFDPIRFARTRRRGGDRWSILLDINP